MIGSARLVPYTGLVLSAALAAAMATPAPTALRLSLALAFACLGPGAALVGHARIAGPAVRWAMVLLLSLAVTVGAASGAIWLDAWHPVPVTLVVAALTAASCLVALVRRPGRATFTPPPAPDADRAARRRLGLADAAVLAGALALWTLAVARTDVSDVGQYGLLASIHPAFFGALVLCCAGFLAEVVRGARRGSALLAYVVLLILLLHATVPLLLTEPEYAWTYKHVGVVALFQQYGQVVDAGDIYQRWPGMFAATAQLADLSGADPLTLARFTPVLLNLASALVLLAIARTLSTDRRVAALTVFLFLCVNWIEEDYLSPQGLAYPLSLGVLLVVLRWLRHQPDDPAGAAARWRAAGAWLRAGVPPAPRVSPAGRAAAVAALVLLDAALTATHQLSPYLAAAQVLTLVALGLTRPRWIALIVVAIPVLFLLPRYSVVSGSFDILESLDIFGNAGGNADGWGSRGQAFSAIVVRALALGVWIATALVVIRAARRREVGSVLVPAVAALAPFLLLVAQSYGGEAIYRVFLFSAPWCAFLLARAAVRTASRRAARRPPAHLHSPGRWRPSRRRPAVAVAAGALGLSMLALATVQGRHGQLMVDQQSAAEVAAAQYLYEHAEPGAVIALATPNFPSRITARYGVYNRSVPVGEPDLVKGAGLKHVWLNDAYLPQIEQFLSSFDGTATYLVISDGMRRHAKYFGYLPDGSIDALDQTLAASPAWSVSYRTTDVTIFRMTGPGRP
jgi:hypothetical protein